MARLIRVSPLLSKLCNEVLHRSCSEMSGVGFAGCMRNVTVAGNPVDFSTGVNSRVIPAGCPAQVCHCV